MKDDEAYERARQAIERDDEGGIDEKRLIEEIASLIDFDPDEERSKKAKRIVQAKRKPGSTPCDGQLALPGWDEYPYEPDRLIADNDGRVIEQAKATPRYKHAQATRTRETARRWLYFADRAQEEEAQFAAWVIDGLKAGRGETALTFDPFVRETGLWSKDQADAETTPPDDDEGGES